MAVTFRWVTYAVVMPIISLFGLMGNVTSILVLRQRNIKLKKNLVEILSALAYFDILFLLTNFLFISFPNWGIGDFHREWPGNFSSIRLYSVVLFAHGTFKFRINAILMSSLIFSTNRNFEHISNLHNFASSDLEHFLDLINLHDCHSGSEPMPGNGEVEKENASLLEILP